MSVTTASLAASLISMQTDSARQSFATSMMKQQAKSEASIADLIEQVADMAQASAPPPPGQGTLVDIRA